MIKIELLIRHPQGEPDLFCPVFICDYCGRKIEKASQGMYHYRQDERWQPKNESILIYHKRPCSDLAEAKEVEQGELHFPWIELRDLPGYLANNAEIDWARMIEDLCPADQLQAVQKAVRKRIKDTLSQ
ncbi:hypothetical protein [Dictyobacter kobayashii]|uniref:Uncharacterized protein n=1 Tax=Dictyobacter kobayashii TaxID=2014872 RepID=A0A402AIK8_9CHLR|nr:hypothetical protein [Dictyobacter kobayashii]GCE18961.1 hypothetical protein KDK_27610 [Dictyobacter kobayashii]